MTTIQNLDFAERWLRDGLHESGHAGAFEGIDVDVSVASQILRQFKMGGRPVTWTHVFICAVASTLAKNPDLHQMVAGNKKFQPSSVDICVSVAGESSVTPVVIIEDAAHKDIFAIAAELIRRSPEAVRDGEQFAMVLRRWGWIVPFSGLRRRLLRLLLDRLWYRRKVSGTFQISSVPHVDVFAPLRFNTAGALGIGAVRERVVVVNGVPAVRPMVTLTCCLDHGVWNGMEAARFLNGVRGILESGEFAPASVSAPRLVDSLATKAS
jgi:pyruvate/2-oxoglutarate dehydrogenase complex dihydrolipoamide acyltransferase (E2) component